MQRVVLRADGEPHASQERTAQTQRRSEESHRNLGDRPKNSAELKVSTNPRFSYLHECSCFMLNTLLHVCACGGVGSQTTTRGAEGGFDSGAE